MTAPAEFETAPERYRHWRLAIEGRVARLALGVDEGGALTPGVVLKLNSYDVAVDLELRDCVRRLRFEHPEVAVVVVESALPDVFCAGANIPTLALASHRFKLDFCRVTNETRLEIEDATRAGQVWLAALRGTASGGGYELALACKRILLVDDRRAVVSLPELPRLAVLPGTGGLTRLVDKRGVRRDRADLFCTLEEGVRAARALEWGLVDAIAPPSGFDALVEREVKAILECAGPAPGDGGTSLDPLAPEVGAGRIGYRHVAVELDPETSTASVAVRVPDEGDPIIGALRLARELDDAWLRLRFHHADLHLWLLRCSGTAQAARALDRSLAGEDRLAREARALWTQVLKRLENSAQSSFALIEPGSAFLGTLLELALAADRSYMQDGEGVEIELSARNAGAHPMGNGLSRLETRFLGDPAALEAARKVSGPLSAARALERGLITAAPDGLDWDDELRLAIGERTSFSPDALAGMAASLRFPGPETLETRIFGRLSAWQNWVFRGSTRLDEWLDSGMRRKA